MLARVLLNKQMIDPFDGKLQIKLISGADVFQQVEYHNELYYTYINYDLRIKFFLKKDKNCNSFEDFKKLILDKKEKYNAEIINRR